jgi:AraC-like DNA-binding protein
LDSVLAPPLALIRSAAVAPVVAFLRGAGAPVERLLGLSHLPPLILHTRESLIPLRQAVHFLEGSARETGIGNLGSLAAGHAAIAMLGMFGHLVRQEVTLARALETAIRAMPAFSSGLSYRLTIEGSRAEVRHEFTDAYAGGSRQAREYFHTLMLGLVRLVQRQREPDEARSTISNGPPVVVFPAGMLERPLEPLFPARAIDEGAVQTWLASTPAGDFAGAVQQVIDTLSFPTAPRIGLTAAAIGISVRGLQRRLAEAGMSYERLVVQSRFATATQLLQNTDATVLDVALDAGYSDHAHFTRAFRRWTGMSPSEFRRTRRGTVRAVNDDRLCLDRAASLMRVESSYQPARERTLVKSFSASSPGIASPMSCSPARALSRPASTARRQPSL